MTYFSNHALDLGRVFYLYGRVHPAKAKRLNGTQLRVRTLDGATSLCNSNFSHGYYPLKTFDNSKPRLRAMV